MTKYSFLLLFLFFFFDVHASRFRLISTKPDPSDLTGRKFENKNANRASIFLKSDFIPVDKDMNSEGEQKLDNITLQKWLYLGGATIAFGAATCFYILANNNYMRYSDATTDATRLHNTIVAEDILCPVSYGISAACFGMFIYKSFQEGKVKKKYNLSVIPVRKGAMVNICINF